MTESKHYTGSVFVGYSLKQAYRNSPDWVVSGFDQDGNGTELFTVNSEGAARGNLHQISGDVAWLHSTGKERRKLRQSPVVQVLQKELDRALDGLATARQGMKDNPEDLEWPGIEEGTIDQLRSLMRVAEAAGLDVSKYETAITGEANASDTPIIDQETGLQVGP